MNDLSSENRIGWLAATLPGASRVFMRRGLDFCCAGKRTLADACHDADLDPELLLAEIKAESAEAEPASLAETRWARRPTDELIEHILEAYHAPLRTELPRLLGMALKVRRVHGKRDPERLGALVDTLLDLHGELESHMMKEEMVLFPAILQGDGLDCRGPIQVMLAEHDDAGDALERVKALTDNFTPPRGACATWRALWGGLQALDLELRLHIHLENNVLFPRVLGE